MISFWLYPTFQYWTNLSFYNATASQHLLATISTLSCRNLTSRMRTEVEPGSMSPDCILLVILLELHHLLLYLTLRHKVEAGWGPGQVGQHQVPECSCAWYDYGIVLDFLYFLSIVAGIASLKVLVLNPDCARASSTCCCRPQWDLERGGYRYNEFSLCTFLPYISIKANMSYVDNWAVNIWHAFVSKYFNFKVWKNIN